jgi:hypothetical protein
VQRQCVVERIHDLVRQRAAPRRTGSQQRRTQRRISSRRPAQHPRTQHPAGATHRDLETFADLGEAAFRDSGLGAPDDIRNLQQALTDRQQQLLELRRQLEERGDELAAARAANRELMTQINTRQ